MGDQCQWDEPIDVVKYILNTSEEMNQLKDVDAMLDKILLEARNLANADAGTIYLVEDEKLKFSYVHNDTLFGYGTNNKHIYSDVTLPINEKSIVGHVALHGEMLAIDDVYDMPPDLPFRFDPSFDEKTGYRTKSILTIPIKSSQSRMVGVIQIINAKDEQGKPVLFSSACQTYIPLFATNASVTIERGIMTRELILRMIKMAELRDPTETGEHVQRVGAWAAEIYHKWALNTGVDLKELKRTKDLIRIAAMLHDVGKVGISDVILKKPAKLTDEEFKLMKCHTVYGAQLFVHSTSELDAMSADVALNHHEKWNGTGYPGKNADFSCDTRQLGEPIRGKEIPLAARITALGDVFDALCSRRSYKARWNDEEILDLISRESGNHFDPEVVDAFLDIFDVIVAIRGKFKEKGEREIEGAVESRVEQHS